ncbi:MULTISPECIES: TetR/AcrR family transcriptional regulator [Paenibacillus]|uniref:TetR/AcrR family transcriptional regulator n=1 Tax=Paenibacillus oleatilyticus TaxID=2594886 RepID=A0ABV4V7S8_9BACL|nr:MULTISPECIES: TetR/AcrR family transcriptional regulator [Paenibacillus]MBU7317921.1 TetR family transcriptional regulator [Paenibacillus oleatilyticus]GLI07447.1 fatty acid metabolism regulator protein [Paenibacillus tyrfis]GMX62513.1 fatty acid metabolism transcriptional regulator FadR [Paenibacillus elgii]
MASKKMEKYNLILDAALKVIAENGYHNAQVSRIAKEAGVADGTIYLYFKNKEDILISLFQKKLGDLVGQFHSSINETDSADEALRKICEIHYTMLEKNVDLAFVTQIELRQSSLELRKEIGLVVKTYIELIEKVLRQGIEEGIFRANLDVKLTRLLVFGSMDEVVTSWLIAGRKYSLAAQVEKTVEFFIQGLKA